MALEIGQRVGEYEVLALLGAGGMGQVYSARNVISGRIEAMKILLPDFAAEAELATRFTVEIRTLAAFDHPNIAQLRTAFEYDNQLVMIMEYVEGTTLEKLPGARPLLVDDALNYSTQILSALAYAHAKGVVHRDIKPANIMITSHGLAKLMDFGIAKSGRDPHLTRPGTTVGSIYYMSPEQVRGGTVDVRSDIYSYGVTLYQMLTGRRPFEGENAYSVLTSQLNEVPAAPGRLNPSLPPGLDEIVLRSMAKAPEERFQSVDEFRQALIRVQKGLEATGSVAVPVVPPVAAAAAASFAALPAANPPARSQRGVWLGLGAAAAIVAMIAAAVLLPHILATQASQKSPAPVTESASPAPSDVGKKSGAGTTARPTGPAGPSTTAATVKPEVAPRPQIQPVPPPPRPASPDGSGTSSAAGHAPSSVPGEAPAPGPTKQEVAQARERMIQLGSKADAATASIQQLRSQQQAQGYGMRGDIVSAMNRMNSYLNEANRAIGEGDLQTANANMDRAEKELSTLDTFLGR